MAAAFQCDWCDKFFVSSDGFIGNWKQTVYKGQTKFRVVLKVSENPHVCKTCWPKFCKLLYDDLRKG